MAFRRLVAGVAPAGLESHLRVRQPWLLVGRLLLRGMVLLRRWFCFGRLRRTGGHAGGGAGVDRLPTPAGAMPQGTSWQGAGPEQQVAPFCRSPR
eukprot:361910-Chlamydomonas_euryale.AAC.2